MTPFLFFVLAVTVLLFTLKKYSQRTYLPPGPFRLPYVGVLPILAYGGFQKNFAKWKIQFGNIFSFNNGSERVVLSDYNLIKAAFSMDEFSGRPFSPHVREIAGEKKRGIVRAEGAHWEAQRRFTLRNLRDFGFGKRSMETAMHEDIVDLIAKFRELKGQPISIGLMFNTSMVNVLSQLLLSHKFELDSHEPHLIGHNLNIGAAVMLGNVKPLPLNDFVLNLAPKWTRWTEFKTSVVFVKKFINDQLQCHKNTFQENNFRNFIDVYINEINQTKDPSSSFFKNAGEENLRTVIMNLFAGGTESMSSTLKWAVFYLSRHPEIQAKFQSEIDHVIGKSRLPSLNDKNDMPFVSATILEILRKSSILPVGAPHRTMSEVKFHGFRIPKHTSVFPNIYDLHHNKEIWGDPEMFRPQRFLTPDGKAMVKGHPPVIPFGIGKRQCIGETMARNTIFLFLVSLFQTFRIKSPLSSPEGVHRPGDLFSFAPDFKVIFTERHEQ